MIRQEITELLKRAIKDSGFKVAEAVVAHPENAEFGDYAASVALQIAKISGMRPKEIAEILKSKISAYAKDEADKQNLFEKIEVAEPGFINFFISKEYLQNQVGEILEQKEKFGQLKIGEDKKINIESVSANPTGQLHIGNGRNAFAGE
ncbi:MAG: arginine--tRNA ligase, partial [Candidatus Nealsonbacteria bacterium]|nr:arginine--tRNA ligase [Candidatus Nealsonbacteria bacterium]